MLFRSPDLGHCALATRELLGFAPQDLYSDLALDGVVELEVDVMPDGSVGTVALARSAGQELDEMAAEAARRFKFTPGTKGGKPVAVRISLKLQIDLHSGGAPMRLLDPSPNPN